MPNLRQRGERLGNTNWISPDNRNTKAQKTTENNKIYVQEVKRLKRQTCWPHSSKHCPDSRKKIFRLILLDIRP